MEKLYEDLAGWWPLLSAPEDYAEEAEFFRKALDDTSQEPIRTVLELGSGGGNNACHLKRHYDLTLVDLAPRMLELSVDLNPECEHLQGDMRSVRLDRTFDAVFVHDAVCYMTTESDLRRAIETAAVHCRPGGVALFAPDFLRENFCEGTEEGGHDREKRSLRYLSWHWDPDPDDTSYQVDYAYILRSESGEVTVEHDRHVEGLFPRAAWLDLMERAGFEPEAIPFVHSEVEAEHEIFVARRAAG